MTVTRTPLPERIRKARLRAGLTQAEAAEAVGYTREYLNTYERGHRNAPELAYKLAKLLGVRVSVADIFESGKSP